MWSSCVRSFRMCATPIAWKPRSTSTLPAETAPNGAIFREHTGNARISLYLYGWWAYLGVLRGLYFPRRIAFYLSGGWDTVDPPIQNPRGPAARSRGWRVSADGARVLADRRRPTRDSDPLARRRRATPIRAALPLFGAARPETQEQIRNLGAERLRRRRGASSSRPILRSRGDVANPPKAGKTESECRPASRAI